MHTYLSTDVYVLQSFLAIKPLTIALNSYLHSRV